MLCRICERREAIENIRYCAPCDQEREEQLQRMEARGDFSITRAMRAYLRAFDEYLAGDEAARHRMDAHLAQMFEEKGLPHPLAGRPAMLADPQPFYRRHVLHLPSAERLALPAG